MTWWLIGTGYGAAWLVTARLLFGWWRSRGMSAKSGQWCPQHGDLDRWRPREGCCFNQVSVNDAEITVAATGAALVWPLVVLAALIRFHPAATPDQRAARAKEREAELERIKARNAELERDLGIGGAE